MEIQNKFLSKYLEKAAIEQLASEYQEQGYEIVESYLNIHADLIVRKDKEVVFIEIKAGEWGNKKRQAVKDIRNIVVHELNAKYKLVLVNLPNEPEMYIDGFENTLTNLLTDNLYGKFSNDATHFWPKEVADISFDKIIVQTENIDVSGNGIITLGLQYGSDRDYERDDGLHMTESYVFYFHLSLNHNLSVEEVYRLELINEE